MINDWSTEEFSALQIKEKMDNKTFDVPKYQRGIVWTNKQRMDLVDTIKKGLPFGTLLLYKKADGTYQIIDGLQRSTALIEFVSNPATFFDESDIDDKAITEISALMGLGGNQKIIEDTIKDKLIDWVKKDHPTMKAVENMQFATFGLKLSQEFPILKGNEINVGNKIAPMMEEYRTICKKICNTRVPAIVVTGDASLLPVLFERINSKGTQLTKYQIYAATWVDEKYIIKDKSLDYLIKANKERYDSMMYNTGAIDDYDSVEFVTNKQLNAFEVAFGFGKLLCHQWPHLFSKSDDINRVESIGFNLRKR